MNDSVKTQWAKMRGEWSKVIITVFIILYIYCVGFWLCPMARWRTALLAPFAQGILYTGIWQEYRMFTPPPDKNFYLEARVKLDNGNAIIWKYPRIEQLGGLEQMQKERFRKLGHEYVVFDEQRILWPDMALYIAKQINAEHKTPANVELIRYTSAIQAPTASKLPPREQNYSAESFFSYKVKSEDLQ